MTKNVGPQTYEFVPDRYKWSGTADNHSALVLDSIRLQDEYLECHRLMENVEGDIIAPIRKFEKRCLCPCSVIIQIAKFPTHPLCFMYSR